MKLLFASDSFKGSLNSEEIITLLDRAAKKVFSNCETIGIPIADGGEGTVNALISATNGYKKLVEVKNPLMQNIEAYYGVINDDTAVIEIAAASGLALLSSDKLNPLNTTSYGTGQLIKTALHDGYRKIIIALGGSATNDGGMGAMSALGVKFFDSEGYLLDGKGENLEYVADIDLTGMPSSISECDFTIMCDVDNPLLGEKGATYTFGAQKGGTEEMLARLEAGMTNYAIHLEQKFNTTVSNIKGGGAAGGLGTAFKIFLNANIKSGIETVLDIVGFDTLLHSVDLVVTGEGSIDWQSAFGKATSGVGMRCKERGVPVIAIVGRIGEGFEKMYELGIDSIMAITDKTMSLEYAMENAHSLYEQAAERAFRMVKIGMKI